MKPQLTDIRGIGPHAADLLEQHGIDSVETLISGGIKKITLVPGFAKLRAEAVIKAAKQLSKIEPQSPNMSDEIKPVKLKKKKKGKVKVAEKEKKAEVKAKKKAAKKEKKAEVKAKKKVAKKEKKAEKKAKKKAAKKEEKARKKLKKEANKAALKAARKAEVAAHKADKEARKALKIKKKTELLAAKVENTKKAKPTGKSLKKKEKKKQ